MKLRYILLCGVGTLAILGVGVTQAPSTSAYFASMLNNAVPKVVSHVGGFPVLGPSKITDNGTQLMYNGAALASGTLPVTKAVVTNQWLNSYSSTTGVFTSAQPAFTNVTGTATIAQGGTGSTTAAAALTALGAAPLASPTFTGTVSAVTTATSDNTTKVATTAFVHAVAPQLHGTITTATTAPTAAVTITGLLATGACLYSANDAAAVTSENLVTAVTVAANTYTLTFSANPAAVGHYNVFCTN